jgi:hypothetical protein
MSLLSPSELCALLLGAGLSLTPENLRSWRSQGFRVPGERVGTNWLYRAEDGFSIAVALEAVGGRLSLAAAFSVTAHPEFAKVRRKLIWTDDYADCEGPFLFVSAAEDAAAFAIEAPASWPRGNPKLDITELRFRSSVLGQRLRNFSRRRLVVIDLREIWHPIAIAAERRRGQPDRSGQM